MVAFLKKMVTIVINDKTSIKTQIELSFAFLVLLTGGITLAVCYGLLYGNATESYKVAESTIRSQTSDSLKTVALEIAASLEQPLKLVGQSVCMTSSLYASILLSYSNVTESGDTLLAPKPSFREYYFEGNCEFPNCPEDFSSLSGKSRLPEMAGFVNGSMSHSSVYLYSSSVKRAARNDSDWNQFIHRNLPIQSVINGLAYIDSDMEVLYRRGAQSTVMFYLASSISSTGAGAAGAYDVIHRTFPGIVKNVTNYDSTQRSWFAKAPIDSYFLYGPYKETFTNQLVVTLSSRKQSVLKPGGSNKRIPVTTVSAAVMLVQNLADIVNSVEYTHSGYGVLLKRATNEVLVWGNRTDVFNEDTQAFKTVADFDDHLAAKLNTNDQSTQAEVVEYTDVAGVAWIVAAVPFFATDSFGSSAAPGSTLALTLLVFAQKDQAERPLAVLQDRITSTTNTVTAETLIIIGATIGVVMVLVCVLVAYISHPLSRMVEISKEIVAMSAEEESKKDYSDILTRSRNNMRAINDEVSVLAADYYHIVCLLHNKSVEKRTTPKYPDNPFYSTPEEVASLQVYDDDDVLETEAEFSDGTVQRDTSYSREATQQPSSLKELISVMARKRRAMVQVQNSTSGTVGNDNINAEAAATHNLPNGTAPVAMVEGSELQQQTPAYDGDLDVLSSLPAASSTRPSTIRVIAEEHPAQPSSMGIFGSWFSNTAASAGPGAANKSHQFAAVSASAPPEELEGVASRDIETGAIELSGLNGLRAASAVSSAVSKVQRTPTPSITGSEIPTTAVYAAVPTESKVVSRVASLKSQLLGMCAVLLAGAVATMVVTIVSLRNEGSTWMDVSSALLLDTQLQTLQSVADIKAVFVQSYFEQLTVDLLVGTAYVTSLVNGNYTRDNFIAEQQFLRSYSMDPNNRFSAPVAQSYNYSSYFVNTDSVCRFSPDNCRATYESDQTKLTSLVDLKLRSYYHARNVVSFVQLAVESDGFTRYLPYTQSVTNSRPVTCLVDDTSTAQCASNYRNSACDATSGYNTYTPYDPRCRSWYQLAADHQADALSSKPSVYFQYPRQSSSGTYVLTAVTPIARHNTFYGVLNTNFLVATLSDSINALRILGTGYCYLIDSGNTSMVILHPGAVSGCQHVHCAESAMSGAEFDAFHTTILLPLQLKQYSEVATEYQKGGTTWQFLYTRVVYGSVDYVLVATVPHSEILKATTDTEDQIDNTVTGMIVAFVIILAFLLCLLPILSYYLVLSIVGPLNDLHAVLDRVKRDDLQDGGIPSAATSLDMRLLLDAFAQFIVSLRFGSESYARGNPHRAHSVFTDALELYTATNNMRGIGASLNNLAATELSLRHYAAAEALYKRAIENASELIQQAKSPAEQETLQHIMSDREGNLAVVYLEQNQFTEAFALLERLLISDRDCGYIRGCVVKQGTLGQYYLKQGEVKSSEKVFLSALDFVRKSHRHPSSSTNQQDVTVIHSSSSSGNHAYNQYHNDGAVDAVDADTENDLVLAHKHEENAMHASEQIALFNLALLAEAQKPPVPSDIEQAYVMALTATPAIHTATTTKILRSLRAHASKQPNATVLVRQIDNLAAEYGFRLTSSAGDTAGQGDVTSSSGTKSVAFVIDYSGSMSGMKIRCAVDNVCSIIEQHLRAEDSVLVVKFSHQVTTALSLQQKGDADHAANILAEVRRMTYPTGSTACYDAVDRTLTQLTNNTHGATVTSSDKWVVVLTDGEDNSSAVTVDALCDRIATYPTISMIVIGVGSDVHTDTVQRMAKSATKGVYIAAASGDRKSINEAFAQVATLIAGEIVMEEM